MKIKTIYTYVSDEGIIKTPINLGIGTPLISFRLLAENGKKITNGFLRDYVVEVKEEEVDQWYETEKTEEEIAEEEQKKSPSNPNHGSIDNTNYKQLLDIITGAET